MIILMRIEKNMYIQIQSSRNNAKIGLVIWRPILR